jgi:hypothetical protein
VLKSVAEFLRRISSIQLATLVEKQTLQRTEYEQTESEDCSLMEYDNDLLGSISHHIGECKLREETSSWRLGRYSTSSCCNNYLGCCENYDPDRKTMVASSLSILGQQSCGLSLWSWNLREQVLNRYLLTADHRAAEHGAVSGDACEEGNESHAYRELSVCERFPSVHSAIDSTGPLSIERPDCSAVSYLSPARTTDHLDCGWGLPTSSSEEGCCRQESCFDALEPEGDVAAEPFDSGTAGTKSIFPSATDLDGLSLTWLNCEITEPCKLGELGPLLTA